MKTLKQIGDSLLRFLRACGPDPNFNAYPAAYIEIEWSDQEACDMFVLYRAKWHAGEIGMYSYCTYHRTAEGGIEKARAWAAHYGIALPNDQAHP
jgi:hypothetical protein